PAGSIALYPAKAGGIVSTFAHQTWNLEGNPGLPWRAGKLCLDTDVRALGGYGLDSEPWEEPAQRLAWHVRRARLWLSLAAAGRLVEAGDPFELPDYRRSGGPLLVFHDI